jgi:hypothetical protein
MGIHPPVETCTAPTMTTLLRLIPPCPTLQGLFGASVEVATYTGLGGHISPSYISEKGKTKRLYREKSINDARDEFHEPLQQDLIALARPVPDLYLAFQRFISRPL